MVQPTPDPDAELVAGLRAGDRDALDAVYEAYRARVFTFLARLSRDRPLAEDLMQETFVRLARRARSLPPETRLAPLLFTIARNLFVDQRRRALLDVDRLRDLRLWPSRAVVETETPFDALEADRTRRHLEAALGALPFKYREALLLVVVEGLTADEAAVVAECSPANLRQRLARGRAMLRDHLERLQRAPRATPEMV